LHGSLLSSRPPNPVPGPCAFRPGELNYWWGSRGHIYTMAIAKDGISITLRVTDGCCAWDVATGSLDSSTNPSQVNVVARNNDNKVVLSNVGSISDFNCQISWSQRWAPWTRVDQPNNTAIWN